MPDKQRYETTEERLYALARGALDVLDRRLYHCGFFAAREEADVAVKAWRAQHMPFSQEAA